MWNSAERGRRAGFRLARTVSTRRGLLVASLDDQGRAVRRRFALSKIQGQSGDSDSDSSCGIKVKAACVVDRALAAEVRMGSLMQLELPTLSTYEQQRAGDAQGSGAGLWRKRSGSTSRMHTCTHSSHVVTRAARAGFNSPLRPIGSGLIHAACWELFARRSGIVAFGAQRWQVAPAATLLLRPASPAKPDPPFTANLRRDNCHRGHFACKR